MNYHVAWIAAEAEPVPPFSRLKEFDEDDGESSEPGRSGPRVEALPVHGFPGNAASEEVEAESEPEELLEELPEEPEDSDLWMYRRETSAMLRRYMRYSIETGRLPSVLGAEFFRAKVTARTVVTFEDRIIFVHDMETCLGKLDEFSRQLLARHVLQEHDQHATARLVHCSVRTVRTWVPIVLDLLSAILIDAGLIRPLDSIRKKSCQGGKSDEITASDCEHGENNF